MYNLKFFSRAPVEGVIPTYRAMTCMSYEISPPMAQVTPADQFADVVMHLSDSKTVTWPLRGNDVLYIENSAGTTIDKIRHPHGPFDEPQFLPQTPLRGGDIPAPTPARDLPRRPQPMDYGLTDP